MRKILLAGAALAVLAFLPQGASAQVKPEPGKALNMVLLPKFLGIVPFDLAHRGAEEAAAELKNSTKLQFLGPTPENSVAGQIEIVTNATTQGVNAIMISNNSGDQIAPAAKAAQAKGITVVTWDSPIPSAEGEDVFVAQVDFNETGKVMADMALNLMGADGGKFVSGLTSRTGCDSSVSSATREKSWKASSVLASSRLARGGATKPRLSCVRVSNTPRRWSTSTPASS